MGNFPFSVKEYNVTEANRDANVLKLLGLLRPWNTFLPNAQHGGLCPLGPRHYTLVDWIKFFILSKINHRCERN